MHSQSYDDVAADLEQACLSFGRGLAHWRKSNGWSQETAETWAKAAGFVPVYNSQWSKLERGLTPQPGPLIFRGLGILNQRIADRDWGDGLPSSLLSRLKKSKPLSDSDGRLWGTHDFYGAFIGQLVFPQPSTPAALGLKAAKAMLAPLQEQLELLELRYPGDKPITTTEQAIAALVLAGVRLELELDGYLSWILHHGSDTHVAHSNEQLIHIANHLCP